MKISVLFQPRDSGITGILQESGFFRVSWKNWNQMILKDTIIQRVPKEEINNLINYLRSMGKSHKVLICSSLENNRDEINRIEHLFFNN